MNEKDLYMTYVDALSSFFIDCVRSAEGELEKNESEFIKGQVDGHQAIIDLLLEHSGANDIEDLNNTLSQKNSYKSFFSQVLPIMIKRWKSIDSPDTEFDRGRKWAYYQFLDTAKDQAEPSQIDEAELGLNQIDFDSN